MRADLHRLVLEPGLEEVGLVMSEYGERVEYWKAPGPLIASYPCAHPLAAELLSSEPSVPGGGDLVPGWNQRSFQWLLASQSLLPPTDPWPMDQPCDSGSLPGRPADLGLGP